MIPLRPPVRRPVRAPFASAVADALAAPGDLDAATRRAFMERAIDVGLGVESAQHVPASMVGLADSIARHAYKVVDEDVTSLLRTGHTQDAVFEALVSTAMGAGLARLACGLAALEGAMAPEDMRHAEAPGGGHEGGGE
ncbi:MAG: hypothetical protein ABI780_14785 [Ardenticatenales bacterium]